jgi:hypothetical protein
MSRKCQIFLYLIIICVSLVFSSCAKKAEPAAEDQECKVFTVIPF